MFTWFLISAPRSPFTFWNCASFWRVPKYWNPAVNRLPRPNSGTAPEIAELGAVGVRRVVDHREGQRMVEVLVVELRRPLERLRLAERRADRQRAARVVVVARLLREARRRVLLLRVLLELLRRQRAGQLLLVVDEPEVEPHRRAAGQDVARRAEGAIARLLAVLAVALELRVAEARVEVERPVHLPRREPSLEEPVRAALDAALEEARVVARAADEVDRAAHRVPAEAERVRALEDLDVLACSGARATRSR